MHRGFRLGAIETGHPPVLATWEMCILAKRYSQLKEDGFFNSGSHGSSAKNGGRFRRTSRIKFFARDQLMGVERMNLGKL